MRWFIALLLLTSCAGSSFNSLDHYLSKKGIQRPTSSNFETCRAYGCQKIDSIELTKIQWKQIDTAFRVKARSARAERKQIAQAISSFEQIVGNINGTSEDIWGTFQKTGHKQQDCVDESTNTSIYLRVLEARGHIKFHTIEIPQSRVPFMKWPHQTAVIMEKESGQKYAVDSWFHNNGQQPEIIELETWKTGWKPGKTKDEDRQ